MRARPLAFYLALLALGLLIPLGAFSSAIVLRLNSDQRTSVEEGLQETARALALAVERELGQSVVALEVLARSQSLLRGEHAWFRATAQDVMEQQGRWSVIAFVDTQGRVIFSAPEPPRVDGPWYPPPSELPEKLLGEAPLVSNVVRSALTDVPAVHVSVPVGPPGARRGHLIAAYRRGMLQGFWEQQRVPTEHLAALVDWDGTLLSRSRAPEEYLGKKSSAHFLGEVRRAPEGVFSSTTLDGVRSVTAWAPLNDGRWTISLSVPEEDVRAPVRSSLGLLVVAGLACCLLALWWAAFVGRRLTRPLGALAELAATPAPKPQLFEALPAMPVQELESLRSALARAAQLVGEREESLRARMLEAQEANQAKDQFLAMLGHELRNPLAAITSAVHLLERQSDPARLERTCALLQRQTKHLARLVDDLLDVARVTAGRIQLQRRPLDLAELVRRNLAVLEASGRTAQHVVSLDLEEAWVEADESRMDQMVTNLLANALKYTPAGGKVNVATGVRQGRAFFEVNDSGVGLSPEDLARVFNLFFQVDASLDRAQGGLGIGLTLVKRLAELHGGTVRAHSHGSGQGATFVIELPQVEAQTEPSKPARPQEVPSRKVVLVEDHAEAREMFLELLESEGHHVRSAEDGQAGLRVVDEFRPDAVLIDIGLPGLSGYELARRLRTTDAGKAAMLVAITGYGQAEDRARALGAGFDEHLVKPVDLGKVRQLLRAAVPS